MASSNTPFPPITPWHRFDEDALAAARLRQGIPYDLSIDPKKVRPFERHDAIFAARRILEQVAPFTDHLPFDITNQDEHPGEEEALFWLTLLKQSRYTDEILSLGWWARDANLSMKTIDLLTNQESTARQLNARVEAELPLDLFLYLARHLHTEWGALFDAFTRETIFCDRVDGEFLHKPHHFVTFLRIAGPPPEAHRERASAFVFEEILTRADPLSHSEILATFPSDPHIRDVLDYHSRHPRALPYSHSLMLLPLRLTDDEEALESFQSLSKGLDQMEDAVLHFVGRFGMEDTDLLFKSAVFASSKNLEARLADALLIRSSGVVQQAVARYESRRARPLLKKYLIEDADEVTIRALLELCDRRGKIQLRALSLLCEIAEHNHTKGALIESVLPEYPEKIRALVEEKLDVIDEIPPLLPFDWSEWHREISKVTLPFSAAVVSFDALPEILDASGERGFVRSLNKGLCALAWWAFEDEETQREVLRRSREAFDLSAMRTMAQDHIALEVMGQECDLESLQRFLTELLETTGFEEHFGSMKVGYRLLEHLGGDLTLHALIAATNQPDRQTEEKSLAILALLATERAEALRQVDKLATSAHSHTLREFASKSLTAYRRERGISLDHYHHLTIPDHGLDQRGERVFDYGNREIKARLINLTDFEFIDLSNDRRYVKIPAPTPADDMERALAAYQEVRQMLLSFDETSRDLTSHFSRLINARAPSPLDTWRSTYQENAIMNALASKLVWSVEDQDNPDFTLTVLPREDGTLVDIELDTFDPEDASRQTIHMTHASELSPNDIQRWSERLGEFEIVQPLEQLGREVYVANDDTLALLDSRIGEALELSTLLSFRAQGWRFQRSEDPDRFDRLTLVTDRGHISIDFEDGILGRLPTETTRTLRLASLTVDVVEDPANHPVDYQSRSHPDPRDPFHLLLDCRELDPTLFSEAMFLIERALVR